MLSRASEISICQVIPRVGVQKVSFLLAVRLSLGTIVAVGVDDDDDAAAEVVSEWEDFFRPSPSPRPRAKVRAPVPTMIPAIMSILRLFPRGGALIFSIEESYVFSPNHGSTDKMRISQSQEDNRK